MTMSSFSEQKSTKNSESKPNKYRKPVDQNVKTQPIPKPSPKLASKSTTKSKPATIITPEG